jgi:succinoglycan biosynthesis protein ExoA
VGAAVIASGSLLDRLRYTVVLATMHVCWGAGFIVGMLRGGGDSVDTSR